MIDIFVLFSLLVILSLSLLIFYTFNLFFRTKVSEFSIIAFFFLFSALAYTFILFSYIYDRLLFYQLERFFLVSSYWFLIYLIHKVRNSGNFTKYLLGLLFGYSLVLLGLVAFWETKSQPSNAKVFGFEINYIENVPYHPDGASIYIEELNVTYGTSFPLLNTVYMIAVSGLLLYTFGTIELQVQTTRTKRAKLLWVISLSLHLFWTILALPWIDLGRIFQFLNVVSSLLIVSIIIFYPEGLILSKSQIMATYHLYDRLNKFEKVESDNLTDLAVEYIVDYISSIPREILEKGRKQS